VLLPLLWAGLRFGPRGATAANLLVSLLVAFFTTQHFTGLTPDQISSGGYIFVLQTSLAVMALVGLIPAIVLGERDKTTAELRDSEERFRNLTEAAFEGIALSENGRITDANDQMLKMFGYERADMIGRQVIELVAPESRAVVAESIRLGREEIYEHRLLRKDGSSFFAEARAKMVHVGGRTLRMTALRDITERKSNEEALRASQELFRAIIEDQTEMIVRWKPDGTRTFVNSAYCRVFGGTRAEFIGTSFFPPISEQDREAVLARIHALTPANPVSTAVHRSVSPVGEVLWQEWTDRAIFDGNGRLVELQSTGRDITDRRRAEAALRASEESLRATIENTPHVAVQWYDAQGCVLFWNSASEKIFGWKSAEALGKTIDQIIFTPETAAGFLEAIAEIGRTGKPIGPVEYSFHRRDGSPGTCLSTVFRIPFVSGQSCFVCMDVDLTDRKDAEESLRRLRERELLSHLEFTQQLIASQEAERTRIAAELHDSLGQNLLIIKNRAQLALTEKTAPADARAQLEGISALASQAIAEVRQISHDLHPYQLDHLGLTRALEVMIDSTAQASGIVFERKLDAVDNVFSADAATNLYRVVQESLNNILKHSRAKRARIELARDVREVQLRIEDDGCGFKNGEVGNGGKGLGLKNIAERVRILNGSLKVDSQPERGTHIEVTIPIAEIE
jgi:PAS domain S-box-containing protein